MGIFDRFRSKSKPPPPSDDRAPGWDAIDAALALLYPGQEPKHLANGGVRWSHDLSGTANPLDGVHIFDAGAFWHYVGLGMTELYGKESKDRGISGLGYDFTFRLRKRAGEALPPVWPVELMNGLGRPAMLGKIAFGPNHTVRTGPFAAAGEAGAKYVGVLVQRDPGLGDIDTPHGRMAFLQLVPVDAATLERAGNGNAHVVLADLAAADPAFITDV